MTLKELRRLIDRIDHKHDERRVMVSTVSGDYDIDDNAEPVTTPEHVFLFVSAAEPISRQRPTHSLSNEEKFR
jgi:hypothetical protein